MRRPYLAATMFSEDGVKYLVWITPSSRCSFGLDWGGVEISRSNGLAPVYLGGLHPIYSPGWMDALLDLDLGLHWDLDLAKDLNTFTEWEVKDIKNGVDCDGMQFVVFTTADKPCGSSGGHRRHSRRSWGRRLWVAMSG